jgi:DNA polymerase-3 subunit epsilon
MNAIAFFDLETTGSDPKTDQIVQIAVIVKSWPELNLISTTKHLVKPNRPISHEATKVHGISWEMVEKEMSFKEIAPQILNLIDGCAIGGFNSNIFDVPILFNEFARAGIYWDWRKHPLIDVGNIFKEYEKRTLSAGAKFYLGVDHVDAHDALADTEVTANIFSEQMKRYNLPADLKELELISNFGKKKLDLSGVFYYGENNEILLGIGDKKGQPAKEHPGMVGWILKNNFPSDVHKICKQLLGHK